MEFCENRTLRHLIDGGELHQDEDLLWRLLREITEGLNHIHKQVDSMCVYISLHVCLHACVHVYMNIPMYIDEVAALLVAVFVVDFCACRMSVVSCLHRVFVVCCLHRVFVVCRLHRG